MGAKCDFTASASDQVAYKVSMTRLVLVCCPGQAHNGSHSSPAFNLGLAPCTSTHSHCDAQIAKTLARDNLKELHVRFAGEQLESMPVEQVARKVSVVRVRVLRCPRHVPPPPFTRRCRPALQLTWHKWLSTVSTFAWMAAHPRIIENTPQSHPFIWYGQ